MKTKKAGEAGFNLGQKVRGLKLELTRTLTAVVTLAMGGPTILREKPEMKVATTEEMFFATCFSQHWFRQNLRDEGISDERALEIYKAAKSSAQGFQAAGTQKEFWEDFKSGAELLKVVTAARPKKAATPSEDEDFSGRYTQPDVGVA